MPAFTRNADHRKARDEGFWRALKHETGNAASAGFVRILGGVVILADPLYHICPLLRCAMLSSVLRAGDRTKAARG